MMVTVANLDEIRVGDRIPSFERTLRNVDLFAYAAATWDWSRVHYDLEYAREHRLPNIFVDGQHYGAIIAQFLTRWLGPKAFISRMKFNARTMTFAGDTLRGEGTIVDIGQADGKVVLTVELTLRKRNEKADLVCACTSVVTVAR